VWPPQGALEREGGEAAARARATDAAGMNGSSSALKHSVGTRTRAKKPSALARA
jgi:hypothetical protein